MGTARALKQRMSARLKSLNKEIPFDVASNPEFLREGRAVGDFGNPDRIVLGVFTQQAEQLLRELYKVFARSNKPVVVTSWGSLGALVMNQHMVDFVARECREGQPFHHIYGVGQRYHSRVLEALKEKGIDLADYPDVDVREYIYDMPVVMDGADVMLSRAGASTISEITAIACPSILVPSPNVTANHQEKNARVLSDRGAAVLMLEPDCTGDKLYEQVQAMLADRAGRARMSQELKAMAHVDANERIYETLCGLMKKA